MSNEVDEWFARYDNPQKELMQQVRAAILAADPRVGERIKSQAPTFTYKGNIASFFPKAMKHVSLMFHTGAAIPGAFPILEGDAAQARTVKIAGEADFAARKDELQAVIRARCSRKG